MKQSILCLLLSISGTFGYSQITKEGTNSRGYLRLGLNQLGTTIDNNQVNTGELSILNSMTKGEYSAEQGYSFEFGKNYYVHKSSLLPVFDAKLGLDWTYLSFSYNQLDLASFAEADRIQGMEVDKSSFVTASASTKLGPVFSINPIKKMVVDLRAQIAATYFVNITDYSAYDPDSQDEKFFTFFGKDDENSNFIAEFAQAGNFGFKPNYGATLRYGFIGLAIDYSPGKIKAKYSSSEEGNGERKFKNNTLQFKVSLTL